MTLRANAVLKFVEYRTNADRSVDLHFFCADPGANQPGDYWITITDAEQQTLITQSDLVTMVKAKLAALYRPVANKVTALDAFIGQAVTV